jgi:hypothetical protein
MNYLPQFFPSNWIKEYEVYGIPFNEEIFIGLL